MALGTDPVVPTPGGLSFLRPYVLARREDFIVGGIFLALSQVCAGLIPEFVRSSLNALGTAHTTGAGRSAAAIAALAFAGALARVSSRVRIFNAGREVEFTLREELLARLHGLGTSFYRRMPPGEIMSRATNDLGQVRLLVGFGALNLMNTVLAYAINIPWMLWRNPTLAILSLLPFPLFVLLTGRFSRSIFQRSRAAQEALGSMSDHAQRNLSGMRVVRGYGVERSEIRTFAALADQALNANLALARLRGVLFPILGVGAALASLIVVWVGSRMVVHHTHGFTPGDIPAFQVRLAQVAWPTIALGFLLSIVQRGRASVDRVAEVLLAAPDITAAAPTHLHTLSGSLSVRGLTYVLDDREVLHYVSFDLPAGRSLAIVGRTGSGKSILARLLARLLPTPTGSVFLDDHDITNLPLGDLRRAVGLAQQDPFLFSTTIARNIAFSTVDPDAPESVTRARAAATEAQLLTEAEAMPDGLDTIVGERGVQLSGGQKQRVSLARALLAEPRVLVLDDPLSAVDARTEAAILDAIERAAVGRTLVLVTHRVAAAARCNEVLVLEAGRVIERGTHDELVARGGTYARFAERQRIEAELEAL